MEVLFVSHKYPPATGGMEKQSFELIEGMSKYAVVHTLVYEGSESRISFFLKLQKRIRQKLRRFPGIQLIHFNDALLATVYSFHKGYRHIPLAATVHGLDISFPSAFYRKHILSRLNRFARIIAVSDATAQAAVESGLHPARVVTVPNGVDTSAVRSVTDNDFEILRRELGLSDRKILMMVGRPVYRKGFSWFITHVFPEIKDNFQVVMAGPFQAQPSFSERILYRLPDGLSKRIMLFMGYPSDERNLREILRKETGVTHLGHQPYAVIQALFQHSAAFLMPNIRVSGDMEGFGLVCLEASVNHALVLAAYIDGIPSAVRHRQNGILIESGNPDAWKSAIQKLNDPFFSGLKNDFTRYTLHHYSWDKMVKAYLEVFENCLTT